MEGRIGDKINPAIRYGQVATSIQAHEISETGAFVRQKVHFSAPFGDGEGELPVEANRYRLIWTSLCPWATRQKIVLDLLGLETVISIGKVNPVGTENGWEFSLDPGGVDPYLGIRYLPEIYARSDPDYSGRATVPVIVDLSTGKVVNNDYYDMTLQWETVWKRFHRTGAPDLYPEELREEIDALNRRIFDEFNNGVYKAGFAESQEEYEKNYHLVFSFLDWLEERLSKGRYLFGDRLTDSDVRLYVTLARFDAAYYFEFHLNKKRIRDYPNVWGYARDLYTIPAFQNATEFDAIKRGYLSGRHAVNPYRIIPVGPDDDAWLEKNDRAERFAVRQERDTEQAASGRETSWDGVTFRYDSDGVDWVRAAEILAESGLSDHSPEEQRRRFEGSDIVVYVYDEDVLVGLGRALSDGRSQGAIYNIAVAASQQGRGLGRAIIERLLQRMEGQNFVLYTHPQTVAFYENLGFRRSKSAMVRFAGTAAQQQWKEEAGFLLPENYRFVDEYGREDMQWKPERN